MRKYKKLPEFISTYIALSFPVEHPKGFPNFLFRVCASHFLGHHIEELCEIYRPTAYGNMPTLSAQSVYLQGNLSVLHVL